MSEQPKPDEFTEDEAPWRPPADEVLDESGEQGLEGLDGGRQPDQTIEESSGGDEGIADESAGQDSEAGDGRDDESEVTDEVGADGGEIAIPSVIEAVLFASDEPVSPQKLAEILGTGTAKDVRACIEQLNTKYEQGGCAFRVENIAGGYQMLTLSQFNPWLKKLLKVRSETKLSGAALETLAIVAYKQPILRVDIEAIRGVAAGEMVRQLCEKGLVKIVGRAEELGRPLLYGTTKRFLEVFGLSSLKELPSNEELKAPG